MMRLDEGADIRLRDLHSIPQNKDGLSELLFQKLELLGQVVDVLISISDLVLELLAFLLLQ
jgi:hypothetical protein